jgi:hypothetical protein
MTNVLANEDRAKIHPESAYMDRMRTFSGVSFAGVPCAQYFVDFYVWEAILNDRAGTDPEGLPRLKAIVELGTLHGGFSLYLAAQANARGMFFRTYDVIAPHRQIPGFVQLDIFAKADVIGRYLEKHEPLILFCDGGNKPRELRTFSRYLSNESVIAVHDWGDEIVDSDVPVELEMVYGAFCQDLGSATRFFVRNDA